MFVLSELPYGYGDLAPTLSERTMRFHHDKHHAAYVNKTNELLGQQSTADSLEDVIRAASRNPDRKKLLNQAAQAWNHGFFWSSMTPQAGKPGSDLAEAIAAAFGDLNGLKAKFVQEGADHFGSGWVWLLADDAGGLSVRSTHDADNTISTGAGTPLIVCDLWEHAYYLDHQNDRKGFLEAWFDRLANWSLAKAQFGAAQGDGATWRYPEPTSGSSMRRAG